MCEAAGADIIDINFGCPVRKVTKTGAGASALDNHEHRDRRHARGRRGRLGARDREAAPRRAQRLARLPRCSARSSPTPARRRSRCTRARPSRCTRAAPTTRSTAELVELVDVPVMASGDITTRAGAQAVLDATGAAAVMIARGAQGDPWLLAELVDGVAAHAERRRARRRARALRARGRARDDAASAPSAGCASSTAGTCAAAGSARACAPRSRRRRRSTRSSGCCSSACPEALPLRRAERPRHRRARRDRGRRAPRPADLDLLRRAEPARRGSPRAGARSTSRRPSSVRSGTCSSTVSAVRGDQPGEPARHEHAGGAAELALHAPHDAVDLAREAVDDAALQRVHRVAADHGRRRDELDAREPRGAVEERLHRDRDAGREHAADVLAPAETASKFVDVPKSTAMHGPPLRASAATALTMRSGPTSRGLSIRIGMPLRTPGPISSVSTPSALSPTPVHSTASTGTVEETTSAVDLGRVEIAQREQAVELHGEIVGRAQRARRDAPGVRELGAVARGPGASACCRRRPRAASAEGQL